MSCQPSGWDQIAAVPKAGPQAVDLGLSPLCLQEGKAPSRDEELRGGLPVKLESPPEGLNITSSGGSGDLGLLQEGLG